MKMGAVCRLALIAILFVASSCDRNIFRDTSKGNMYVSFRVDGERYTCEKKNVNMESPMRLSFYDNNFLDFHVNCHLAQTMEGTADLAFTISDTEFIEKGRKYSLGYYTGEDTDRVGNPPVFFAEFNDYRSTEGWVKLRAIKAYRDKPGHKVISGNFEFKARNKDGHIIEITNGTFDGIY